MSLNCLYTLDERSVLIPLYPVGNVKLIYLVSKIHENEYLNYLNVTFANICTIWALNTTTDSYAEDTPADETISCGQYVP